MRNRTRMIAAAVAVSAAVAAASGAAVAASAGGKPSAPATASGIKGGNAAKAGHAAMVAVVARDLHLSTARVAAALAPLFAAGHAYPGSPVLAAAARSLGVSTQGLIAALTHAKLSLAGPAATKQGPAATKQGPAGTKAGAAADKAGHDAMAASEASELHLAVARVSAALAPLFAAGGAEPDSPLLQAAARDLGVSAQQLNTALVHAKQSLASASQP
jgi:hypothetical protein